MVALKTERRIYMWGLEARPNPREAPPVSLDDALDIIANAYGMGTAKGYIQEDGSMSATPGAGDKKNCIYIADYRKRANGERFFLINRGDPEAADVAFLSDNSSVRSVTPEDDEVQGWSAHLIISHKLWKGKLRRTCFESMQNVSGSLVIKLFEQILLDHTKGDDRYFFDKPIKKNKKYAVERRPYKIVISMNRKPSENLMEDLSNGTLRGITLTNLKTEYTGLGSSDIVKGVENKIRIKTVPVDKSLVMQYINDVVLPFAKDHDFTEIQFDIDNPPRGSIFVSSI